MIILGLTGSIAMGKTTAHRMLVRLGVPVHDADATVHRLFARGGAAVAPVAAAFPGAAVDGAIDRARLSQAVVGNDAAFRRLEAIVHPLVRAAEAEFLKRQRLARVPLVALDVPLLFETGGEARCHAVAVLSAPLFLQRLRVLARPGMTEAKFQAILARQMPDAEKRRRADWVVPTGLGRALTRRALAGIVRDLRAGRLPRRSPGRRRRNPE
ncbi:dephospho-CoA kinase [Caenispirillum bisanense]|uniref:dephospho-CoA kinase n=1 Tax=Caenispirillum bisanense TaxID=414052 RepID=UPI0031D1B3EA